MKKDINKAAAVKLFISRFIVYGILFFLAFLPSFTTSSSSLSPAVQTLLFGTLFCALVPFVYLPAIVAADFFRARLVGSVKATACLKLTSAVMLAAVVVLLLSKII